MNYKLKTKIVGSINFIDPTNNSFCLLYPVSILTSDLIRGVVEPTKHM